MRRRQGGKWSKDFHKESIVLRINMIFLKITFMFDYKIINFKANPKKKKIIYLYNKIKNKLFAICSES